MVRYSYWVKLPQYNLKVVNVRNLIKLFKVKARVVKYFYFVTEYKFKLLQTSLVIFILFYVMYVIIYLFYLHFMTKSV